MIAPNPDKCEKYQVKTLTTLTLFETKTSQKHATSYLRAILHRIHRV